MKLAPATLRDEDRFEIGRFRLAAIELNDVTELLPIGDIDVSPALQTAIGAAFPPPGESAIVGDVRVLWFGRDAALVLGARLEIEGALCVDQSDGWAAMELRGEVRQVLARLCPLDVRDRSFAVGATARTLLNHVAVSLTRIDEDTWLLLVPRSYAATVRDELAAAAVGVAAR